MPLLYSTLLLCDSAQFVTLQSWVAIARSTSTLGRSDPDHSPPPQGQDILHRETSLLFLVNSSHREAIATSGSTTEPRDPAATRRAIPTPDPGPFARSQADRFLSTLYIWTGRTEEDFVPVRV